MCDNRKETKDKVMLKQLSKELRDKVRSGCTIVTVAQCVEELVFNSIDAGATKMYVAINMKTFKVEVEDDGCGLSKTDLELVGKRYVTSKLTTEEDLRRIKDYGYRGEALASIISVSKSVKLMTRPRRSEFAYIRWFRHGQSSDIRIEEVQNSTKPPPGFTITVEGLLETQPVRQKRLDRSIQLEDVRTTLEHIALINPNISIELRNEPNISPLWTYTPCFSYGDAFDKLYSTKKTDSFSFVTENHLQDGLMFTATIGRQTYRQKCYQFVFVNRRCVERRMKIHKTMNDLLMQVLSDSQKDKSSPFPVFILNISCCLDKYYPQRDSKFGVAFWDWESCLKGVGGLVLKFQSREFPLSKPVDLGLPLSLRKDIQASQRKSYANNKQAVITNNKSFLEKSSGHHDITTHDVKNVIHSKRVFREESQEPCSQEDSINSYNDDDSQPRNLKSNDDLANSDEIMSTTYSDLADSPSRFYQKVPPPRPKKSTAKHVVYTVRRSPRGRGKQLPTNGAPRKDIVVPRIPLPPIKSMLNKDVFSKFPQWKNKIESQNNATKRKIGLDREGTTSRLPEKRTKYSNLKYEPRAALNKAPKLACKDMNISAAHSLLQTRRTLPDDYQFDDNEIRGIDWKLKRFMSDSNLSHEDGLECLAKRDEEEDSEYNSGDSSSRTPLSKPRVEVAETSLASLSLRPEKSTTSSRKPKRLKTPNKYSLLQTPHGDNSEDVDMFAKLVVKSADEFVVSKGLSIRANIEKVLESDFLNPHEVDEPNPIIELAEEKVENQEEDNANEWDVWEVDVISNPNGSGHDWLKVVDGGQTMFINLSNGDLSYDMVNVVKLNRGTNTGLTTHNWLRHYFPKGYDQLWKRGVSIKPQINGNVAASTNYLSDEVKECIVKSTEDSGEVFDKWRPEAIICNSQYQPPMDTSEYFTTTTTVSEIPPQTNFAGKLETKLYSTKVLKYMKFKKDDLRNIKVISQWDRKFIVAKLTINEFDANNDGIKGLNEVLVLLDQHAVHERIRLERLICELYETDKQSGQKKFIGVRIEPPFKLNVSEHETRILDSFNESFKRIALEIQIIDSTSVNIRSAPVCILKKAMTESSSLSHTTALKNMLTELIQEEVGKMMDSKTTSVDTIPKTIFKILCSQACHGAIKFGDDLELAVCESMISSLQNCRMPFQCAHGRPSMVPLMDLSSFVHESFGGSSNKSYNHAFDEYQTTDFSYDHADITTELKQSVYFQN